MKTHHTLICDCCNGGRVDVTLDGDAWEAQCENCGPKLRMPDHVLDAMRYADKRLAEARLAPAKNVNALPWRERWVRSGPTHGWSIVEDVVDGRLIARLGKSVSPDEVSVIVAAHNAAIAVPASFQEPALKLK